MKATAILLNYKREPNIRRIISTLKTQTAELHIVLVNNGEPYIPHSAEDTPDELFVMGHNLGPFARFLVAYAYEGWLYFQDDDVLPRDDRYVEDLLTVAAEYPRVITGTFAREIHHRPPHYMHNDNPVLGETSFIKAICMTMHRKALGKVRIPLVNVGRSDDLHVSLEIGRGEKVHHVDNRFSARLEQLDQMGTGLCHEPQHYTERDAYCGWWLRKEGII